MFYIKHDWFAKNKYEDNCNLRAANYVKTSIFPAYAIDNSHDIFRLEPKRKRAFDTAKF